MSNEAKIQILKDKREKINSVSCSFCTAKWLQTTLMLQNGYNHSCHHPVPHKIPLEEIAVDPAALHNSKFKKQQRAKMLKGERPSECDYCWNIEDLGKDYFSDRHFKTADYWAWDRFDEIAKSNPDDNVYPSYLEVSFSNACNFACAYCSPEISSKWMEDIKQNGPYPTKHGAHHLEYLQQVGKMPYRHNEDNPYVNAFWKWFPDALPHLKVFRITGGEPLMSKDTWKVLDYFIENPKSDLEIAINTNLGVPDELIDRFIEKIRTLEPLVKKIDVYTSLESTGAQAEYARDGLDYIKWKSNVSKMLEQISGQIIVMTTVNILSLPTFEQFIEDIMEFRRLHNHSFEYNRIPVSINYLRHPPHLQCTLLDKETRLKYANSIEKTCEGWLKYYSTEKYARIYLEEFNRIKAFCDYLRETETITDLRKDFIKFVDAFDTRRNKNFRETFPEYANLLEEWNGQ